MQYLIYKWRATSKFQLVWHCCGRQRGGLCCHLWWCCWRFANIFFHRLKHWLEQLKVCGVRHEIPVAKQNPKRYEQRADHQQQQGAALLALRRSLFLHVESTKYVKLLKFTCRMRANKRRRLLSTTMRGSNRHGQLRRIYLSIQKQRVNNEVDTLCSALYNAA